MHTIRIARFANSAKREAFGDAGAKCVKASWHHSARPLGPAVHAGVQPRYLSPTSSLGRHRHSPRTSGTRALCPMDLPARLGKLQPRLAVGTSTGLDRDRNTHPRLSLAKFVGTPVGSPKRHDTQSSNHNFV